MSTFDKDNFRELSKIIDAKEYDGWYDTFGDCKCYTDECSKDIFIFNNVTFNKEFKFVGYVINSFAEDTNTELNELLKIRTYNHIQIICGYDDHIGEDRTLSVILCYNTITNIKKSIEVKLQITKQIYVELYTYCKKNCYSYNC